MIPFLRYAKSKFEKEQQLLAFRLYITDMMYYNAEGQMLEHRFYDIINGNIGEEITEENVMEKIDDILEKAGLEVAE